MELTLENLILYLEKEYPYNFNFSPQFILREIDDGIGAFDILENIAKEFNVSFENFDFHQYFLDEAELNTLTWKHLLQLKKQREIEEELTIQKLYDYMLCNKKSPN
jgi:hypothetical protein